MSDADGAKLAPTNGGRSRGNHEWALVRSNAPGLAPGMFTESGLRERAGRVGGLQHCMQNRLMIVSYTSSYAIGGTHL